jgi:serine protease
MKRLAFRMFSAAAVLMLSASTYGRPTPGTEPEFVPGRLMIKVKKGASVQLARGEMAALGIRAMAKDLYDPRVQVVEVPAGMALETAMSRLRGVSAIEFVERDYIAHAFACGVLNPNDQYYQSHQENLRVIGAHETWNCARGEGVIVAVIDTGVRQNLADWRSGLFVPGKSFVSNAPTPDDDNGHGSHVASTIAEATNNGIGAAGIAFQAQIMPVKVLNSEGSGSFSEIVAGINWATQNGAHVINMSLGASQGSSILQQAVQNARQAGVLVVCASGNDGHNQISFPAAYAESIAVGALSRNGTTLADFSNTGPQLDLVAPGVDIAQQTINFDNPSDQGTYYYLLSGTSMASPHVAGALAIAWSLSGSSTGTTATVPRSKARSDEIEAALYASVVDMGSSGKDQQFGYGRLNLKALVERLGSGDPGPTPSPTPGPTPSPTPAPGTPPSWCQPYSPIYTYRAAQDTPASIAPAGQSEVEMETFGTVFPTELTLAVQIDHDAAEELGSYDEFGTFLPGVLAVDYLYSGILMGTLYLDTTNTLTGSGIQGCWDVSGNDFGFLFGAGSYVLHAAGPAGASGSIQLFGVTEY